jgi:RHS repeat-associated protein
MAVASSCACVLFAFCLAPGAASAACTPSISSISALSDAETQTVTIVGSCFGTQAAYEDGDSASLELDDESGDWRACWENDPIAPNYVTCSISSWTDTSITFTGFSGSWYRWSLSNGDSVDFLVNNPQTGDGPASCVVTVNGGPTNCDSDLNVPPITPGEQGGGSNASIPGDCSCDQSPGEPVNTATGDFYETSTDASVGSFGPGVAFTRTYNSVVAQAQSASDVPGALGYGWSDSWDMSLSLDDPASGDVTVDQADGAQVTFVPPVSGFCPSPDVGPGTVGTFCAPTDVTATLSYDSGTSKYTFITHPYTRYMFNSSGELLSESEPGGATVTLTDDSPSPGTGACPSASASCRTVAAASGRALVIAYDSSGLIEKVIDPLGNVWTYAHCVAPSSTCSTGDLTSVTDPQGNVTSFTYDESNGNSELAHDLLTVTEPNGQPGGTHAGAYLVNVYNASGQVVSQTDPDRHATSFDYSNLDVTLGTGDTVVTDPDGNQTQYVFNDGVLTGKTEGYGTASPSEWVYGRDPNMLVKTTVTDPDGDNTAYEYDSDGNVVSVTNPLGATISYSYNSFDEQTCKALALAASGCGSLSPPAAVTGGGSISSPSSAPPDYVTYSLYDTAGNLIYETAGDYQPGASSASQSRTSFQLYNGESVTLGGHTDSCAASAPAGSLPCATIDPDGNVTQLGYDSTTGDLTSSSTPDGNSGSEVAETTYSYTGDGQLSTETDPKGNLPGATAALYTTTNTYTDDGWLQTVTVGETAGDTTARETSYGYDGDGNQTSVTDPLGNETTYSFDADDQQTMVSDPDGNRTLTCYDGDGNVTQVVPPAGVAAHSLTPGSCPSSFPADYGNRLAADATTYAYDAQGDKTVITTPAPEGQSGHETTTNTYDAAGRLQSTVSPPSSNSGSAPDQETAYTYDNAGDVLTVTTQGADGSNASMTSYCYDPDGERTATVAPDGNTSLTPAACSGSSPYQTTSSYQSGYTFDSLGETVSRTRPATTASPDGQTTTYTYDPAGNQLTSVDPNGVTTTETYTPLGEVTARSYSGDSAHSVSYTYDANGNRVTMSDGTGTSTYAYDPFDELLSYENGAGNTVTYTYDDDGDVTAIGYPLGGASWADGNDDVDYTYNDADLMTSVTPFGGSTSSIHNNADGLPDSLTLGSSGDTLTTRYDSADNPTQITLANSGTPVQQFGYSYEPSGAVASETDTPALSSSTSNFGFDASGNATTLPGSTSGSFDDSSELTSTTTGGTSTDYSYNADGERTGATVSGSSTMTASYAGNGHLTSYHDTAANMTAASYDGDGLRQSDTIAGTTTNFTWDPSGTVPRLLEDSTNAYIYGPGSTPIAQVNLTTGNTTFLISDRLGSVRGIVNSTGSVIATGSYDPAGNPTTSTLAADTPFGSAGAYTDPTGLEYLIDRYYDPGTDQFLTLDPLVDLTDEPYGYANDNPANGTDPTGLCDVNPLASSNCYDDAANAVSSGVNDAVNAGETAGSAVVDTAEAAAPYAEAVGADIGCAATAEDPGVDVETCGEAEELTAAAIEDAAGSQAASASEDASAAAEDQATEEATEDEPTCPATEEAGEGASLSGNPNFDNPAESPGAGWEWRGPADKGSWFNPATGESLHPDLEHPEPIGPHYDYRAPDGQFYRIFPDGTVVPK